MPYKFETSKQYIPIKKDKRVKLSAKDKEEIRYRYLKIGDVSQRELAREYDVSRRLIVFVIYPERQEENYQKRIDKGGSKQYYNKDKHTEAMRKHRKYKKELQDSGELVNSKH